jgi:hypothetical protein
MERRFTLRHDPVENELFDLDYEDYHERQVKPYKPAR